MILNTTESQAEMETAQTLEDFLAGVEKRAYRTAILSTRRAADALDVVQDAMLQLVQKYAARPSKEWPMLFQRILHNRIIDWHRSQARTRKWFWQASTEWEEGGESDEVMDYADFSEEPSEVLQRARDMRCLMSALEALPVRQRQAFLLRAWEGLDTESTAEVMGCSGGSVKTHYFRALQSLRVALEKQ